MISRHNYISTFVAMENQLENLLLSPNASIETTTPTVSPPAAVQVEAPIELPTELLKLPIVRIEELTAGKNVCQEFKGYSLRDIRELVEKENINPNNHHEKIIMGAPAAVQTSRRNVNGYLPIENYGKLPSFFSAPWDRSREE